MTPSSAGTPRPSPFPGLRPFEADEAHLFFGREGQTTEMLKKLSRTRFLAVVGTSGSGKSSLVRAGLLPDIYGGVMTSVGSGWRCGILRPGGDPIGNLAAALNSPEVFGGSEKDKDGPIRADLLETTLRRGALGLVEVVRGAKMAPHENLLVVVDQFEELFRFRQALKDVRATDEAAAFVRLLLAAVGQKELPIYVVLTMRSDYLGDCAQFRDLPEALNDSQYLIPRMTRDQRRAAITGPAGVAGVEVAPRLVQRLLNDVGDNPDQLPILQHALLRTWDCWVEDHAAAEPIDLRHYEAIGGMAEALSRHADEALGELADADSRRFAEKMFKCLAEKGADNREVRRPTSLGRICDVAEAPEATVRRVIECFRKPGRSFLMPPAGIDLKPDDLVDISHESLIRQWKQLGQWVDEEAESGKEYLWLADAALRFESGQGGLLRDPDLRFALQWKEAQRPNRRWAELYDPNFDQAMQFLSRSSRRAAVRKAALITLVLALLGGGAGYAIREVLLQRDHAEAQMQRATRYATEANESTKRVLREFGWQTSQLHDVKVVDPGYGSGGKPSSVQDQAPAPVPASSGASAEQSLAADREREQLLKSTSQDYGNRAAISVQYFPKDVDGRKVEDALEELGFALDRKKAPIPDIATNAIWYGSPVSIQDVKLVAYTLIRAGVQIRTIRPFPDHSPRKDQPLIQVGADRAYATSQVLTVDDIRGASRFGR